MKQNTLYTIFLSLLIVLAIPLSHAQGLQFYGNEKRFAERSSFRVFDEKEEPTVRQHLSISFEYAAQNLESPGYIFYLKDSESGKAYNLTYVYDKNDTISVGKFMFAEDGKQIFHTSTHLAERLHRKWILLRLDIDLAQDKAELEIAGARTAIAGLGLKQTEFSPQLTFGMCEHILETASFSIRGLTVTCDGTLRHFPLNESRGEAVHDKEGRITGHVKNPVWLIKQSYHWKPLLCTYSSTPSGLAFSPQAQQCYVYNHDSLLTFDLIEHAAQKVPYAESCPPPPIRLGMNAYDAKLNCIYAYELNLENTYIACIEPASARWKMLKQKTTDLQMHHHAALFLPEKRRFVFFGGYGNRKYYNTFLTYDLDCQKWDTLKLTGTPIPPRFFAGMTATADGRFAYLYGGKGNEAGDQNVGIQYYYDFYRVDLATGEVKKLWEHPAPETNRVPTRDMVLSPDGQSVYVLAYPEYKPQTQLQLYRLSLTDGTYEALGDSVPLISEEIATNARLIYNKELEEFYCVVQEFEKYGENTTRIYSLACPPVSLSAVRLYDDKKNSSTLLFLTVLLSLGVVVGTLFLRKRRPKSSRLASPVHAEALSSPPTSVPAETEPEVLLLPAPGTAKPNSLLLFGNFTALNREGRNITYMFSNKIRHLFFYLLLNSITKEGVLSSDLNSIFWPDKPDNKIKNLKNVTISHLRKVLQEIEGVELTYQKGYFRLTFSEECYCDFLRLFRLTEGLKSTSEKEEERIELYWILARGKFLANTSSSLFDYSKQQVEDFILPLLTEQLKKSYKKGAHSIAIHLCNILFQIDPLSETAIRYAICIYHRQNKQETARLLYSNFCKEYRKTMGEEYPVAFDELRGGGKLTVDSGQLIVDS